MADPGRSQARRRRTFSGQFPPIDDLTPTRRPRTSKMGDRSPQLESPGSKTSGRNGRLSTPSPRDTKVDSSRKDNGYSKVYKDAVHPEWPSGMRENSDLHRDILRQDSFDNSIRFPSPKRGSESPDIGSNKKDMVTPDQLFGPMSPRRSSSYNDIPRSNGYQTVEFSRSMPVSRDQGLRMGKSLDNVRGNESRLVRAKSRKSSQSMAPIQKSETPLKSTSRFESVDSAYIDEQSNVRHSDIEKCDIRNTTTVTINKNQFNDSYHNPKLGRRFLSSLSRQSRGSSYYHGDIVDDNLMISPSKLDSTLIRLFAVPRNSKPGTDAEGQLMPFLNYSQSDLISLDPVTWRVRPMDPVHKETLNQEIDFLASAICPREIIKNLYQDEAITLMDYNQLVRTEGQGDKAVTRLLIRTLQRRGEKAYPSLIKSLGLNDYNDVCKRLANTEHILEKGMLEDRAEYQKKMQMENFKGVSTPFDIEHSRKTPKSAIAVNESWTPYQPIYTVSPNPMAPPGQVPVHVITPVPIPMTSQEPVMTSHRASPTIHVMSGDSTSANYHVVDSLKLEKHLTDLNMELKALHNDVTALKTSRSSSLSNTGRNSKIDRRPENFEPASENQLRGQDKAKHSSSCSVL